MSGLTPGSMFAGCRLEAVAGRGGMGVVYRATQVGLGRPVAVKAVTPELAGDAEFRERFTRESHLAASLEHPNVIPVYEAGEADGTLYLIMRWVDGTDLRALVEAERRLSPVRAVALVRPVAAALAAAHRRGLVHRDVKPANVLIARAAEGEEEHVYLTDFGIARRTDGDSGMTRTGMFVGTVDYAAPERIEGGRGTGAADIYSLGCVLFEVLTGHVPFDRPSTVAKMFAHVNDPIPSASAEAPAVPRRFDEIIQHAMAKRPEDRYAGAGELVSALDRALAALDGDERTATRLARRAPATRGAITRPGEPAATTRIKRTTDVPAATATATAAVTRPASARNSRRRPVLAGLGAAVLVAVVVAVVIGLAGSGGSGGSGGGKPSSTASTPAGDTATTSITTSTASSTPAGTSSPTASSSPVAAIRGAGLSRITTAALGSPPAGASSDASGAAWVALPAAGQIAQVSSGSGTRTTYSVGGRPSAVAATGQGIWVAGGGAAPLTLLREGRVRVRTPLSAEPVAIAASRQDGTAWSVSGNGSVAHFGTDGQLAGSARVTPAPTALRVGEGWVWAVNGAAQGLIRIDPRHYGQTRAFSAGPDLVSVALDRGVWVASADGQVTRFNPRTDKLNVNATLTTGAPSLDAIAAAEGRPVVWAISRQAKTLYRIANSHSPSVTGTVVFRSAPVALAADDQHAWVATADGSLLEFAGG